MDPTPRTATRADFDQIIASLDAFWGPRDVRHLHHPMAIEQFGDGALVVEDANGRIAAYLLGMLLGDRRMAYVHLVAVRADARGRGCARALYECFFDRAVARGCTEVTAITAPSNTDSLAFHAALKMVGDEVPDYSGPGQSRVVLRRRLPAAPRAVDPPVAGVTLRAATPADVGAVLAFWQLAAHDGDRPADRAEAVQGLIVRDPSALLLALRDGAIVGTVIVGWDGWRAHLYRLAVHPDLRRRGMAQWLLTVAEQRLRAAGAIRIDAMVLDDNDGGRAIWSAAGYVRQDNWSRWVRPL